jgi:hypothetical protein
MASNMNIREVNKIITKLIDKNISIKSLEIKLKAYLLNIS